MILYLLFRLTLLPFLFLALIHPKVRQRLLAEFKYRIYSYDYDVIFHISSEGELEQSISLIEKYENMRVHILFTSLSALEKVKKIESANIKFSLLPVLSFNPFIKEYCVLLWKKPVCFFMCRYDFFPELVLFSYSSYSILLNATFKNLDSTLKRYYYKFSFNSFDKIVLASEHEKTSMNILGLKKDFRVYDFRVDHILKRKKNAQKVLLEYGQLVEFIKKQHDRYIFGSFWASEIRYFEKESFEKTKIFVCPHKLDFNELKRIENGFKELGLRVCVINNVVESTFKDSDVYIIAMRGILCELYTLFETCYVGGGYEKSIHSVLEPFLMGCNSILTGPKINRSTEFDFVKSHQGQIKSLDRITKQIISNEGKLTKTLDMPNEDVVKWILDAKT
ncbi:MAG: hypothetical protein N4A33_00155 [Bacteriovoracaceae bacterium]|jgi:3-deoxy-D-manno-octulosonic-acid transferase|nr:hypothetical protein [Bacteriovoracaceae bacterium]